MMNWLDIVILLVLFLAMLNGFKTGFIKGINGIVSFLAAIFAAVKLNEMLAGYLAEQWHWDDKISDFLLSRLQENTGGEAVTGALPLNSSVANIDMIASTVLNAAAFLMIVLGVYILIKIILGFASRITSNTILSPVDKLGGLVLGLVKGTLFITVILALLVSLQVPLSFITSPGDGPGFLSNALGNSLIVSSVVEILQVYGLPVPVQATKVVYAAAVTVL